MLDFLRRLFSGSQAPDPEPPVPEKMPCSVCVIRGEELAKVIWFKDKIFAMMPIGELTDRLYVLRNETRIIDHMLQATLTPHGCSAFSTTYLLEDVGPYTPGHAKWHAETRLLVDNWWEQARPHVHSVKIEATKEEML